MFSERERECHKATKRLAQIARLEATAEWRAIGRKEGREEGIKLGILVGRISVYQDLLKLPFTPKEELMALSAEDLEAKANALQDQLLAK